MSNQQICIYCLLIIIHKTHIGLYKPFNICVSFTCKVVQNRHQQLQSSRIENDVDFANRNTYPFPPPDQNRTSWYDPNEPVSNWRNMYGLKSTFLHTHTHTHPYWWETMYESFMKTFKTWDKLCKQNVSFKFNFPRRQRLGFQTFHPASWHWPK